MKAALINDTSGENHVGCNAVIAAIRGVAAMHGIEIDQTFTRREPGPVGFKTDLIIINGEGSLHHNSGNTKFLWAWLRYAQHHSIPAVLINTVWDGMVLNDRNLELLNTLELVSCRESLSEDQMSQVYKHNSLWNVPDMIFAHYPLLEPRVLSKQGMAYCPGSGGFAKSIANRPNQLLIQQPNPLSFYAFCDKLASYDGVVTDRFHTCCIAMMCGVPVYALPANCHKVNGLAKDSGSFDVFVLVERAGEGVHKSRHQRIGKQEISAADVVSARKEIHELFYAIKGI